MLVPWLVLLLSGSHAVSCQYDKECGDDDLEASRGVCFPPMPEPPPMSDAGQGDGGQGDGGQGDGGGATSDPRCAATCELIGRCVAENAEASAALMSELQQLGFEGTEQEGCTKTCDEKRAGAGDDAVLDCFASENQTAMCSAGLIGALPAVNAVNKCCENASDSEFCVFLCGLLVENATAGDFFDSCPPLLP